jgi:hypothetical protein
MSVNLYNNLTFNKTPPIARIQDTDYSYEAIIFNSDGIEFKINPNAIADFKIVDELEKFYHYGFITFKNDHDVLESIETVDADNNTKMFNPYIFRGDGRDFLRVSIKPTKQEGDLLTGSSKKDDEFKLSFIFSIYDYEDLFGENRGEKFKKLYFWDFTYQILTERNSHFTTSKYSKGLSDSDRSIYTGEAIKNLLTEIFKEEIQGKIEFNTGFDKGSSKIFYSSPAGFKAIDDLNYLLDRHVSSKETDYSPCIFKKDRNSKFSLLPLTTYFNKAFYKGNERLGNLGGEFLIENFVMGKQDSSDRGNNNSPTRNPGISLFCSNLADYSYVENYNVSNMTADDTQSNMISYYVHNYDHNSKLFTIESNENSFETNNKIYNKNIVNFMKGRAGKSPSSNMNTNLFRKENKNLKHVYNNSTSSEQRLNSGRNKFLLSSIFMNTAISFRTNGNVRRQSGRFVTIQRNNAQSDSSFDNKVMGIYMITNIVHSFTNGGYQNYIVCTKAYNMDDNKLTSNIL